ncbi:MAG: sensor histidine kinase [Ilumatobacteraceae bacterium]
MKRVFVDIVRSLWRQPAVVPVPRWSGWDFVAMGAVLIVGVVDVHAAGFGWPGLRLVTVVVLGALVLVRRIQPLTGALGFAGVVAAVSGVLVANDHEVLVSAVLAPLVVFSLVRWASGRHIVVGLIGLAPFATVVSAVTVNSEPAGVVVSPVVAALFWLTPCLLGYVARAQMEIRDQRLRDVQRDERQRIARELHDSVAHHVSGIAIQAKAARAISAVDPAGADAAIAQVERLASVALDEMRQMVGGLRDDNGPVLTPLQGIADIDQLARSGPSLPVIEVTTVGGYDDVSVPVQAALYRIAQEAVTNSRRHAGDAKLVTVSLAVSDGAIHLRVADDGATAHAGRRTGGHGLTGMAERVALLGGEFHAGPAPSGGWSVTATIPRHRVATS